MNTLDYTVGNLGNHEFNYGLKYLHDALAGAKFPYVNANIIDVKTKKPLFTPYLIKETEVVDQDGKKTDAENRLYRFCAAADHDVG